MSSYSNKIRIFYRLNKLKMKAGAEFGDTRPGYIDPTAVKRAQTAIGDGEEEYYDEIEAILVRIESAWDDLQIAKDDKKKKILMRDLLNYANNVKDIAATYEYDLMSYFGGSLRDFCEKASVDQEEHCAIIQAHIDVIAITFKTHIKDSIGFQAEELKDLLAKAIEQYS